VIATEREVERLNRQLEVAILIERDASELSYLWNDYLLYRESQLRTRWESKFAAFSVDVASLDLEAPEQRVLVDKIKENQERLKAVFADVASALEGTTRSGDSAVHGDLIEDSWSRMAVQNQGIFFDASRLSQILRAQVDHSRKSNTLLVSSLFGVLGAYFLTNYLLIHRGLSCEGQLSGHNSMPAIRNKGGYFE